jgi:hypothetical protein
VRLIGSNVPDLVVATGIALVVLNGAVRILRLKEPAVAQSGVCTGCRWERRSQCSRQFPDPGLLPWPSIRGTLVRGTLPGRSFSADQGAENLIAVI